MANRPPDYDNMLLLAEQYPELRRECSGHLQNHNGITWTAHRHNRCVLSPEATCKCDQCDCQGRGWVLPPEAEWMGLLFDRAIRKFRYLEIQQPTPDHDWRAWLQRWSYTVDYILDTGPTPRAALIAAMVVAAGSARKPEQETTDG